MRHLDRERHLQRALRLEYFTVAWNILEGSVAIGAALSAGSVALLGFGIDSFVETASGLILVWRLRAETGQTTTAELERLERRAQRLVAGSLFGLAAYIAFDASKAPFLRARPEASPLGIAVTGLSMGVMWWLAREKRSAAKALGSRALVSAGVAGG